MTKPSIIAAACVAAFLPVSAAAGVVAVETDAAVVMVGETFEVRVVFDADEDEFLSAAEFDFSFDDELFAFVGATPGEELILDGDEDYIGSDEEPLVFEANVLAPGELDVFAESYNSSAFLAANQADEFPVVTLAFEVLTTGSGDLGVAALDDFFADLFGAPIDVSIGDGFVTVDAVGEVVPLPGAALFLLTGLAGAAARRRSA